MAFRRRPASVPSITKRLQETFDKNVRIGPFLAAEVDLAQVWGRTGLVRMPGTQDAAATSNEPVEATARRLAEAGYLRMGPPRPDEPSRDQVPATVGPDREPVTLLGDFGIVCALRGRPAAAIELRIHVRPDRLDQVIRMYAAGKPSVMLQEVPLDYGRLGFFLYRADRGLLAAAGACGVEGDTLKAVTPPTPAQRPAADAHRGWEEWTEVQVARASGEKVSLTTFTVGRGRDGLWIVEPPYDGATAVWRSPDEVGERLSELLSPVEGLPSWLPDEQSPSGGLDG